jgi:hypothetical protein
MPVTGAEQPRSPGRSISTSTACPTATARGCARRSPRKRRCSGAWRGRAMTSRSAIAMLRGHLDVDGSYQTRSSHSSRCDAAFAVSPLAPAGRSTRRTWCRARSADATMRSAAAFRPAGASSTLRRWRTRPVPALEPRYRVELPARAPTRVAARPVAAGNRCPLGAARWPERRGRPTRGLAEGASKLGGAGEVVVEVARRGWRPARPSARGRRRLGLGSLMAARQALVAPAAGLSAALSIGSAWIDALQLAPAPAGGARSAHQPAGVMELSSPDSAARPAH